MNFSYHGSFLVRLRISLLVVLLAIAQLGAFTHALGHLKAGDEGGQTSETACEWCAAYAHSGDAIAGGCAPLLPVAAGAAGEPLVVAPPLHAFPFVAYLSQAPPRLS